AANRCFCRSIQSLLMSFHPAALSPARAAQGALPLPFIMHGFAGKVKRWGAEFVESSFLSHPLLQKRDGARKPLLWQINGQIAMAVPFCLIDPAVWMDGPEKFRRLPDAFHFLFAIPVHHLGFVLADAGFQAVIQDRKSVV